jgi:hypothetical protein
VPALALLVPGITQCSNGSGGDEKTASPDTDAAGARADPGGDGAAGQDGPTDAAGKTSSPTIAAVIPLGQNMDCLPEALPPGDGGGGPTSCRVDVKGVAGACEGGGLGAIHIASMRASSCPRFTGFTRCAANPAAVVFTRSPA